MDQRGSLVDTNLKIYPSDKLIAFIKTLPFSDDVPINVLRFIDDKAKMSNEKKEKTNIVEVQFTTADIENIKRIKDAIGDQAVNDITNKESVENEEQNGDPLKNLEESKDKEGNGKSSEKDVTSSNDCNSEEKSDLYLTTSDVDWVYFHINERKNNGDENVPYLHEIFQGSDIVMPENRLLKRNPVLEARCVKLRAQQEAREYRKMTKGVDNVRMRYPEDSISYQLKQMNRQLIAIGQFIISIFAGFLFGFRGVEWMVGNLDFGVRLLLGVMCALIIALAEIYFLAKKLNEELTMTETVQLGGPPKFANQPEYNIPKSTVPDDKEHQD